MGGQDNDVPVTTEEAHECNSLPYRMAVRSNVDTSTSTRKCRGGPNVVRVDGQCGTSELTALRRAVSEVKSTAVCLLV